VTWHRFRHMYLDSLYQRIADRPNGLDIMQEIAGHNNQGSLQPYVIRARQRNAMKAMEELGDGLFQPS